MHVDIQLVYILVCTGVHRSKQVCLCVCRYVQVCGFLPITDCDAHCCLVVVHSKDTHYLWIREQRESQRVEHAFLSKLKYRRIDWPHIDTALDLLVYHESPCFLLLPFNLFSTFGLL